MIRNALTIDVEDYYHVAALEAVIRVEDWERYESRVEKNTHRLLDLLERYATKATFFVLGWVAERQPHLVRTLAERGHEVASHGYAHQRVYTQTPEQFREETRRSKAILEEIIGRAVLGYRAATYSITRQSLWALDILQEEGFVYDSSIFPVRHDLYGIAGYPRFCHVIEGKQGAGLIEFPLSTLQCGKMSIPIAGGGYLRLFPFAFTQWGIRHLNVAEQRPAVVYLHPWEVDPEQPRVSVRGLSRFRHYHNLARMEGRLAGLLQEFNFSSMQEVLHDQGFHLV